MPCSKTSCSFGSNQQNSGSGPFTAQPEYTPNIQIEGLMILRSEYDLTVVRVIDLEWVYAGPAQLFGSTRWWLLRDEPINIEWDLEPGELPNGLVASAYFVQSLGIVIRVLEAEKHVSYD